MHVLFNLVFFKIVWAASLAGVVLGYAWLGLVMLGVFASWHAMASPTAKADFVLAGAAVMIGLVLDTLYVQGGLIAYRGELLWTGAAPLWILVLWANFALTMNGCLAWLGKRKAMAAALAFVCGPLSYYGGIAIGTATVTADEWKLFTAIGVAWALAVPLMLTLAGHFVERLHPEHLTQSAATAPA